MYKFLLLVILLLTPLHLFATPDYNSSIKLCQNASANTIITYHRLADVAGIEYSKSSCSKLYQKLAKNNHLNLSNSDLVDLQPIAELTQLTSLVLSHNNILDISQIQHLHKLQKLFIDNNYITDLAPLSSFHALTVLDISHNPLGKLPNFENNYNVVTLHAASINQTSSKLNISHINKLKDLKYLNLSFNNINDIKPISRLNYLETIDFSNNTIFSITAIKSLQTLKSINFMNNRIADITPLENLIHLENINLSINQISSINVLTKIESSFISLSIADNKIKDISPLTELMVLKKDGMVLSVSGNPLLSCSPRNVDELKKGVTCQTADENSLYWKLKSFIANNF